MFPNPFGKLLTAINTKANLRAAGALLSTALIAVAGQLAYPVQMEEALTELHVHLSSFDIALTCAVISSILHRYTSPPVQNS